jgi:hypothetical protein
MNDIKPEQIQVVCAWCKVHLSGPERMARRKTDEKANGALAISYGMCKACKESGAIFGMEK